MPQTTYADAPTIALAGMLADSGNYDISSYPAAEDIPPGRLCEIKSDGTIELPKGTTLGNPAGVSCYLSMSPPGGYKAGDMVPCVRKGRVWADFTGTGATDGEAVKVRHASDDSNSEAQHRGKFTDAAASVTVGQEKSAFSRAVFRQGISTTLAKVDVNFP